MRTLELKDIAGYLPYGLKVYDIEEKDIGIIDILKLEHATTELKFALNNKYVKPLLKPMSDLTKPILEGGKIPIVELAKICTGIVQMDYTITDVLEITLTLPDRYLIFSCCNGFLLQSKGLKELRKTKMFISNQYQLFDFLHQYHFDCRGLIEAGLAIDINTVKQ